MMQAPLSKAEAQQHRYNKWAGNPKGSPYREDRCACEVFDGRALFYQCCRKPGHGPAGLFCKQHAQKVTA